MKPAPEQRGEQLLEPAIEGYGTVRHAMACGSHYRTGQCIYLPSFKEDNLCAKGHLLMWLQ